MDKDFEPGSILNKRDYTKHNQLGLILSIGVCAFVLVVAYIVPLLS